MKVSGSMIKSMESVYFIGAMAIYTKVNGRWELYQAAVENSWHLDLLMRESFWMESEREREFSPGEMEPCIRDNLRTTRYTEKVKPDSATREHTRETTLMDWCMVKANLLGLTEESMLVNTLRIRNMEWESWAFQTEDFMKGNGKMVNKME